MGNTQKYHFRQEWNLAFESKLYILCVTSMNFFVLLLASILTVQSKKNPKPIISFPFDVVVSCQLVCNVWGEGMK